MNTHRHKHDDGHIAAAFAANAERITNNVLLDEWVDLYAPNAIADWTFDGIHSRFEGIDAIRAGATELAAI